MSIQFWIEADYFVHIYIHYILNKEAPILHTTINNIFLEQNIFVFLPTILADISMAAVKVLEVSGWTT